MPLLHPSRPCLQFNENESSRADIFKEIDILIALKHENIVFMKGAALGSCCAQLAGWVWGVTPQRHS